MISLLICSRSDLVAQTLPTFVLDRRADQVYMDSLSQLAWQHYSFFQKAPSTPRNDTLRFESLLYLGNLFKWWHGRYDSTLFFADQLTKQAQIKKNLKFSVLGILLSESYYHSIKQNYLQALHLNFQAKDLLQNAKQELMLMWRVDMNLGELYGLAGDSQRAIQFLLNAQEGIRKGSGLNVQTTIKNQAFIEQKIGAIYKQLGNFPLSEQYYLTAKTIVERGQSKTSQAYVYDDLGELYLLSKQYNLALFYAKKAEEIWDRIKPVGQSNSWGTLACVYYGLGDYERALMYAQKVVQLKRPTVYVQEQAYQTLYQLFEQKHDWATSTQYYKKYIIARDSIAFIQRKNELASLQKKAELNQLQLQTQQDQRLQAERLLTLQKQSELDKLQARFRTKTLLETATLSDQQRRFEREQADALLKEQRATQRLDKQAFDQQVLQQESRMQKNWLFFISIFSVLIIGLLILLLYSVQLRRRKVEATLQLATERKEADRRLIQTQELERQRMAADLHDDLGGTIAILRRRLLDLRQHMGEPHIIQEFDALQPLIQRSSADLRRIAHNLMPPEFARIGLTHALEQLIHSQPSQPTHFTFFSSSVQRKFSVETELNIYRIVSELIQNINKHAEAQRAAVQMLYHETYLSVTVEDDGLGSHVTKLTPEYTGIGLKTISLRANYIGASLRKDASQAGTLFVLDVPYSSNYEPGWKSNSYSSG